MKKLLIALPFLWMLFSCAKKDAPTPQTPSCRITSVNDSTGKAKETLIYNSGGNLVEIKYINSNEPSKYFEYKNSKVVLCTFDKNKIEYKYNNLNQLDTILRYENDYLKSRVVFGYDSDGNIASRTSYYNYREVFLIRDSCLYTGYSNGRPRQMEEIQGQRKNIYTYEYDKNMNRTKTYFANNGGTPVLIQENTFDLSHNAPSLIEYIYKSSPIFGSITHISSYVKDGDQELFDAGAVMDKSLPLESKYFNERDQLIDYTSVTDMKTIYGAYPKSWKLMFSDPNIPDRYLNLSYSCE